MYFNARSGIRTHEPNVRAAVYSICLSVATVMGDDSFFYVSMATSYFLYFMPRNIQYKVKEDEEQSLI
jgi:hypothetical protein